MDTITTLDTSHKAYIAPNLNEVHHVIPTGSSVWMIMNGIFWSIFLITLVLSKNLSESNRKKLGGHRGVFVKEIALEKMTRHIQMQPPVWKAGIICDGHAWDFLIW